MPEISGNSVCIIGKTRSYLNVIGKDKKALRFWVEDSDGNNNNQYVINNYRYN